MLYPTGTILYTRIHTTHTTQELQKQTKMLSLFSVFVCVVNGYSSASSWGVDEVCSNFEIMPNFKDFEMQVRARHIDGQALCDDAFLVEVADFGFPFGIRKQYERKLLGSTTRLLHSCRRQKALKSGMASYKCC